MIPGCIFNVNENTSRTTGERGVIQRSSGGRPQYCGRFSSSGRREIAFAIRLASSRRIGDKTEDRLGIREFLGMQHFTAHDLRRTAATIARRAGAPRPDVKALLDHINGDMTAVYDKYTTC